MEQRAYVQNIFVFGGLSSLTRPFGILTVGNFVLFVCLMAVKCKKWVSEVMEWLSRCFFSTILFIDGICSCLVELIRLLSVFMISAGINKSDIQAFLNLARLRRFSAFSKDFLTLAYLSVRRHIPNSKRTETIKRI